MWAFFFAPRAGHIIALVNCLLCEVPVLVVSQHVELLTPCLEALVRLAVPRVFADVDRAAAHVACSPCWLPCCGCRCPCCIRSSGNPSTSLVRIVFCGPYFV